MEGFKQKLSARKWGGKAVRSAAAHSAATAVGRAVAPGWAAGSGASLAASAAHLEAVVGPAEAVAGWAGEGVAKARRRAAARAGREVVEETAGVGEDR